jgi:membrane-bound lytic murein transglycosylase B
LSPLAFQVVFATLLATAALAFGAPPPPGAPIPRDPAALAARMQATTRDLGAAVDRWRASEAARPPLEVTLYALYQQRILILLTEKPTLSAGVLARLPRQEAKPLRSELAARRELRRLSQPRPLSAFLTGPAEPPAKLLGYYRAAERRFGVAWNVLAAVNFVESAFNKLRNASSAGAQGPMQFIPATWRAYGLGGNIHDPHDAILGAANYLRANGAPRDYPRALFRYNPSPFYVEAVLRYAQLIRSDSRAFYGLYSRQVFVRTPRGLVRLTGPR